jgi:N-acyl-L-homoserine lactone synthetase
VPLSVDVAKSPEQLRAAHRLRFDHVVRSGWARPEDLTDGLERDAYDDRAAHVAVWDADDLVGTVRLVFPSHGVRLPVEDDFGMEIEPHGEAVEVGRLVIAAERRGDLAHRAWGALFGRAWLEVRGRGYGVVAGAATRGLVDVYRSLGLPIEILGPAREHWGEARHPVRLDPSAARRATWFAAGSSAAS